MQKKLRQFKIGNWKLEIGNSRKGVTLIELLLTVSIIILITLLAAPFYSRFFTQNAVTDSQNKLAGVLRKAQIYSMAGKQGNTWGVRYTPSPNRFTLFLTGNSAFDEHYTVEGSVVVSGWPGDITFNKLTGEPSSTPTIILTGGNTTKSVIINAEGAISAP